ncbi:MAG: NADH-quinone oxidoreductase subunit C [Pseudomonadota bacterium]
MSTNEEQTETESPASEPALVAALREAFGDSVSIEVGHTAEVTLTVPHASLIEVTRRLRDDTAFAFTMLMDLCGVDYLSFGQDEWKTDSATDSGFSRGVQREVIVDDSDQFEEGRFAVVLHLLSLEHNRRLRVRAYTTPDNPPRVPSVIDVWNGADWYEREAFDLFGIIFDGHPDLRRLLTDYGFIGHPFRKDFPLVGNVEVRYDAERGRVAYQPVTIEPRTLVPRVIRDDNRYDEALREQPDV